MFKPKNQVLDFDYKICPKEVLFEKFKTSQMGLSDHEAEQRLADYGFNEASRKKKRTVILQFFSKFFHPLVVLLVVISAVTYLSGDKISSFIVGAMAIMSVALGFVQEYKAGKEAE